MSRTPEDIAAELENLRLEDETDEVEVVEEEQEEAPEEDNPPGFKSYEQYVKDGGDPDMYKGKKAYEAEKKRIDENKKLHAEVRDLKKSTDSIAEAMQEWQQSERDKMRKELEARFKEQKEAYDLDGALETREQLDSLKKEEKKPPKLNPVIVQFTEDNPIINRDSEQFNQEFFDDMARLQAKKINAMSDNGGADLTNAQILKCTKAAYEEAKELNKELFVSSRNDRQGAPSKKPAVTTADKGASLEVRLKNFKVVDARDPEGLNSNAPWEMYQLLKAKDPKAAERFAKSTLGE